MILLLLTTAVLQPASKLEAPIPRGNPGNWIRSEDYPQNALSNGISGITVFSVMAADKDGPPIACWINKSSGEASLDQKACDLVMQRANFIAAKLPDGTPTHGIYRNNVIWLAGISGEVDGQYSDMDIAVAELPKGVRRMTYVHLRAAFNSSGRVEFCEVRDTKKITKLLGELTCSLVRKSLNSTPPKMADGKTYGWVQSLTVSFDVSKSK